MLKRVLNIVNPRKLISKGNLPIVALCFFIASSFWLVKALNKRYNAKINLPIKFDYNHDKIFCRTETPDKIWIDAQSTGWVLLQHKLGLKDDTLSYHIGNFFEKTQKVDKDDLTRFISNNTKDILVNQILTDNIELVFEGLKSKTIQVVIDNQLLNHSPELQLVEVNVSPQFINIKGPSSVLRKMGDKYYLPIKIDSNNKNTKQTYFTNFKPDTNVLSNVRKIKVELIFKNHE